MLGRLLAFVALAASFIPASFAQQGTLQGQGTVQGQGQIIVGPPAVPPTVTVTPPSQNLAVSTTQIFTPTVTNDNFNLGVTWALSGAGCSGSTCGTLSAATTKSGVPVTYTAPASAPTPNLVILTATSVTNPSPVSSAVVNITIVTPPPQMTVITPVCAPGVQTPAAINTFTCPPSVAGAQIIPIAVASLDVIDNVQVCQSSSGPCVTLTQAFPPSGPGFGSTTPGGKTEIFWGVGLPLGETQVVVTNSSPMGGALDIGRIEVQNLNGFDIAGQCSATTGVPVPCNGSTPTTNPVGATVTPTNPNELVVSILSTTGNTSAAAPPFNLIMLNGGDGVAYQVTSAIGPQTPNWTTTSGTWSAFTAAFVGGTTSPVVSVALDQTTASVLTNSTSLFTPRVTNGSQGVNWTLSGAGCSGATCGTLSASTTGSGIPVTYTAPNAVPSPATVTLTATSIDDPTKTATATITVTSNPIVVGISQTSASVQTSATQVFSCTVTNDAASAGCDWTLTGGGCSGATCGTLSVSHTASGVNLTYTAPASVPSPATVTLTTASTTDNTKTAAATITVFAPPAIVVSVSPGSASVQTTNVKTFSCTVVNDAGSAGCDWTLTGAGCSGATCGTISVSHTASGVNLTYTAPGSVPSPATVTLTAASTADNTKTAAATITVTTAPILTVSVSPGTASVQNGHTQAFTPTVVNDGSNLGVDWTLTGAGCSGATCGTLSLAHTASGAATTYTAPVTVPSPATVTITATSTTDNTKSASSTITVFSLPIAVTVAPGTATTILKATQTFTGTVTNDAANAGVDWTLTGGGCTGATCGTLSAAHTASGVATTYTAPGLLPSPATVTITAKSTTDNTKSASSTITVVVPPNITVTVAPTTTSLTVNSTKTFAATLTNDTVNNGVTWTLSGAGCSGATCGTVSPTSSASGAPVTYTAPNAVPSPATVTLTARSVSDVTKTGTATITVTALVVSVTVAPTTVTLSAQTTPTFEDDFNTGTLSPNWIISNRSGVEGGGSFSPTAVSVSQGMLQLKVTQDGTTAGSVGGEIQYNQQFGYGTYEWTMRSASTSATPNGTGTAVSGQISSNFTFAGGSPNPTEIDNPEIEGQHPNSIEYTVWKNGVQSSTSTVTLANPEAAFHRYKFIWSPGSVVFYIDDVAQFTTTTNVPTAPAFPLINLWGTNSTSFGGLATAGVTRYMYVSAFKYWAAAAAPTQQFTATVANSGSGVNWTLSCSVANCGTISATTSASNVPITYTAPQTPIALVVSLTATSISDGTKSATATINVTPVSGQQNCVGKPCPAFFGTGGNAQGSAAVTPGGRGGVVYNITTTDDNTHAGCTPLNADNVTCSLRDCVSASGARTCIFRVAGTITQQNRLSIFNPFITIAGQSAPGGGITLGGPNQGECLWASGHDIVIRYLSYSGDNPAINTGPNGGTGCFEVASGATTNIYLDHLSGRWYGNKAFAFNNNQGPTAGIDHVTYSWILVYEPICGNSTPTTFPLFPGGPYTVNCHPVGSLGTDSNNGSALAVRDIDFHHNMIINADHRLPFIQGGNTSRWVNNIQACWNQYAVLTLGGENIDWINNKWKDCTLSTTFQGVISGDLVHNFLANVGNDPNDPSDNCLNGPCDNAGPPTWYMLGNTGRVGRTPVNNGGTQLTPTNVVNDAGEISMTSRGAECGDQCDSNSTGPIPGTWFRATPLPTEPFPIIPDPVTNLDNIVPQLVGNSQRLDCLGNFIANRNSQDTRVILQYQNNQGGTLFNFQIADPPIAAGTPCVESLHDGIPDQWKQRYGLSTTNATLYKTTDPATGLTYLEEYLDGLTPNGATALSAGILDPTRAIDWTQAGVVGGIPSASWTQCGSTIGAYSGTAAAINAALSACNGQSKYVLLGAGTFNLTTTISLSGLSNVALRGSGPNSTFIVFTSGFSASPQPCHAATAVCMYNGVGPFSDTFIQGVQDCKWTAGYSQGTTSITLTNCGTEGLKNGEVLVLDQKNDLLDNGGYMVCDTNGGTGPFSSGAGTTCMANTVGNGNTGRTLDGSGNKCSSGSTCYPYAQEQYVTVVSGCASPCNGPGPYTVTLSSGLYANNWNGTGAVGAWFINASKFLGVENLTLDKSATNVPISVVEMADCYSCWVKNIRSLKGNRNHVWMLNSPRSEVRDSYFYATTNAASQSYGVETYPSGDDLVENNVFQQITSPIMPGGGAGNVIGYNFSIDNVVNAPSFLQSSYLSHSDGDYMNLYEGNVFNSLLTDQLHGTSGLITVFRNWVNGLDWNTFSSTANHPSVQTNALGPASYTRGMNVIGNVLGTPGYHTTYQYLPPTSPSSAQASLAIYTLGYANLYGGTAGVIDDVKVATTLMRWGNYDTVNAAVRWDATESSPGAVTYINANPTPASHALPASFYLTAKPSFFNTPQGTLPYPLIGPDVVSGNGGTWTSGTYAQGICPVGKVSGGSTCASNLGGLANMNPAMNCYFNVMNGPSDGSGSALVFDASSCYP